MKSIDERFWDRIDKNGPVPEHRPDLGQCHTWTGAKTPAGYGTIHFEEKSWYTHRLVIHLNGFLIPPKAFACHHCDNRACCNLGHLFVGSAKQNHQDMMDKQRGKWHRVLTDDQVIEMRLRFARGEKMPDLAAELNVHVEVLRAPVMGKTWKHLPLPQELIHFVEYQKTRRELYCIHDHLRSEFGYKRPDKSGWECSECHRISARRQKERLNGIDRT